MFINQVHPAFLRRRAFPLTIFNKTPVLYSIEHCEPQLWAVKQIAQYHGNIQSFLPDLFSRQSEDHGSLRYVDSRTGPWGSSFHTLCIY